MLTGSSPEGPTTPNEVTPGDPAILEVRIQPGKLVEVRSDDELIDEKEVDQAILDAWQQIAAKANVRHGDIGAKSAREVVIRVKGGLETVQCGVNSAKQYSRIQIFAVLQMMVGGQRRANFA